jgi:hypothetical protein
MQFEPSPNLASARLLELTRGALVSQAVSVAASLGVADELASGPCPVDELAKAVGAHGPTLYRILRALHDVGVFQELEGRRFALTPLGELLRSDAPGSMRRWAILVGQAYTVSAVTGLLESVRTGAPAFEHVHGRTVFDYLGDHSDASELFDAAMADQARSWIHPVVGSCDFSPFRTVVDVGGSGALLAAILRANPQVRGVLYDLPDVVAGAGRLLEEAGVGDRCERVGGDFFEAVPRAATPTCSPTSFTTGTTSGPCGSWRTAAPPWGSVAACCLRRRCSRIASDPPRPS